MGPRSARHGARAISGTSRGATPGSGTASASPPASATAGAPTASPTGQFPALVRVPAPTPPVGRLEDPERCWWISSASIMHVATGLFLSGAWMQYEYHGVNQQEVFDENPNINRPDTRLWWVDAGIQKNW